MIYIFLFFFLFFFFLPKQTIRALGPLPSPFPPTTLPYKRQLKTDETITPKEITKHSTISRQPPTKQKKFYWNVPLQGREKQEQEEFMELKGTGQMGEQGGRREAESKLRADA